jgi:hypothetical protein
MRRAVFAVVVLHAAACSVLVDVASLQHDAGAPTPDSGSAETGAEATTTTDAAPDVFDFVCPDASIVCDDFDDSPLGARWSAVRVVASSLTIDSDGSVSPPNSLFVFLPQNPSSSARYTRLEQSISNLSMLDCQLAFRLDATTSMGSANTRLFALDLAPSGFSTYEIYVSMESKRLTFDQTTTKTTNDGGVNLSGSDAVANIATATWFQLRFKTDFKTVQISIDGVLAYDKGLITAIPKGSGKIYVGNGYDTEMPSWAYRVDDVLCVGN